MARPSAGDFTGKEKARLAKEAQAQQLEAAKTTSMATVTEERRKNAEVVDYTVTKKQAPKVDTGPKDLTAVADEEDETIARIVAGTSEPEPGMIDEPEDLVEVAPVSVEKTKVLIRAKYEMKQVTIGRGTFYDFEEGQRYYVPPHVAQHLEERDYVDIL